MKRFPQAIVAATFGAAGILALMNVASAQEAPATETPTTEAPDREHRGDRVRDALAPLVSGGTITQAQADAVIGALEAARPGRGLTTPDVTGLLERLAGSGIAGGATYDAIIGETPRLAGAVLATRDRRAAPTYEAVGAEIQLENDEP